jgi:hypothetical protein
MESMAVKIEKEKRKQNVICENTKFGGKKEAKCYL